MECKREECALVWCTAPPQGKLQSARHCGWPPVSSKSCSALCCRHLGRRNEPPAGAQRPPVFQLAPISSKEAIKRPWHGQLRDVGSCSISGDGEDSTTPSPEGGQGENHSSCSAVGSRASGTHSLKERTISFPSRFSGPWDDSVWDALLPHSRPWPILPAAKRVRFGDDIPPHAPLASPVWDPGSSVRMPQNASPSVPSTLTPFLCTTTGMSNVPLEPLAQRLEAWLTLPSLSRWLTRTIRLGYAIQFTRWPPKFNAVLETSVTVRNAPVLREGIAVLLAKDAIEPVPPAEIRQGFYSPYFIIPKKGGGLRPILDLRVLTLRLSRTSTGWEVYDHTACHSSPAISSSEVTRSSSHCALFTSRGSSIVRSTRSHDSSHSPESGDSIPRWSGWSGVDLGKLRWTCLLPPCPPTASCTFPWPRAPSAQTHWHTAGLRPYANMRFPQWAYLHCASSGRTKSRSCWLHPIGPPGPGFPNSFPSRQHLPGAFLWGRTSSLRGSAPYGAHVQIYGTSMYGSWTGRSRLERSTTGSGRDHHSG